MKYLRLLTVLSLMSLGLSMASCGGDDEPKSKSRIEAFAGSARIDGTNVDFYVSSHHEAVSDWGRLIMFFPNTYHETIFYGDISKVDFYTTVMIDGTQVRITRDTYSAVIVYDGKNSAYLNMTDIYYWQNKYDASEAACIKCYYEYVNASVRYPDLALTAAKNHQQIMARIHRWAEEDGFKLRLSEWETKNL